MFGISNTERFQINSDLKGCVLTCFQMFDPIHNRTLGFLFQNEEDERLDMPELSKEEKEAKKNTRPKTRFGRVSKPPKHMVKVRISK